MNSTAITPESILPALLYHLPHSDSTRLNRLLRDARNDSSFEAETPKRIASLLDAIASISVENPQGDDIAVALDSGEDLSIFIASDAGVSTQLIAHLTSVWALVRQISNRAFADQGSHDDTIKLNHQLIIQIYRFSWRKFHARFWKRADAFIHGLTLATQWYSDQPQMVEVLRHCRNLLVIFNSLCNGIILPCPTDATLLNIHRTCTALARSLESHLSAPDSYLDTIQEYIGASASSYSRLFFLCTDKYCKQTFIWNLAPSFLYDATSKINVAHVLSTYLVSVGPVSKAQAISLGTSQDRFHTALRGQGVPCRFLPSCLSQNLSKP